MGKCSVNAEDFVEAIVKCRVNATGVAEAMGK
jgi:hypothetical protein